MTLTEHVIDLGPSRTHRHRTAAWVPTVPGEGLLTIAQRRTAGGREETDVYAVQEETSRGCRSFLLLNATDADQPDVYGLVVVGGVAVKCTCRAGLVNAHVCKHKAAIQILISEGLL